MYHYIDLAYQNRDADQYGKYDEKLSALAEDCLGRSISYFRAYLRAHPFGTQETLVSSARTHLQKSRATLRLSRTF